MTTRVVRLVYPHQLFAEHLSAGPGTRFLLVEDDLFFRQYRFHSHKLVLHRASMRAFAARLADAGYHVDSIDSDPDRQSGTKLAERLQALRPERVEVYDVVDDWLARDCRAALSDSGLTRVLEVLESPNFLTSRAQVRTWFARHWARMQHFYSWQRTRLDILVERRATGRRPVVVRHREPAQAAPQPSGAGRSSAGS